MSPQMRFWIGLLVAWLAGSGAGTAVVGLYVGLHAARDVWLLFLGLIGLWGVLALPFAVRRARRQRLTPGSVYAYAAISAVLAAAVFFALFVYFLMWTLPASFLTAAVAFHLVALRTGAGRRTAV